MALPIARELLYPVLKAVKDLGGEASIPEIMGKVIDDLRISEEDQEIAHKGARSELDYRLAWSRTTLRKAGYLKIFARGKWQITSEGESVLVSGKDINPRNLTSAEDQELLEEVESEFDEAIETDEFSSSGDEIEEPFDPKAVDVQGKPMNLDLVFKRILHNEIDLAPPFQRKSDLWNPIQQSRLIESILIKLPLPAFFFDGSVEDRWVVVDGLQRLSAFKNFAVDKTLKLTGLEFLSHQLNGKGFDELPSNLRRRLEEAEINAYVIKPGTPERVKFILFKRINTGGMVLSSQEIRHALNQGAAAEFVKELAELYEFKRSVCWSVPTDRMLDREFVTRFLSFDLLESESYRPDLDSFLNTGLSKLGKISDEKREQLKARFIQGVETAWTIFGNDAFRKRYRENDPRKPINKALFEVWTVTLGKLSSFENHVLMNKSEEVKKEFIQLMQNSEFDQSITQGTGDRKKVRYRFEKIKELVNSVLAQ